MSKPHAPQLRVIVSPAQMQRRSDKWIGSGRKVGLVPTMGALHAGHLALITRARRECETVVVSIYVNPLQFGPHEDLGKYPRPKREDLALCRQAGVNYVFAPTNLYAADHSTFVEETSLAQGREGESRPGHFRGVATVVLKLFLLVRPTHAYFGQKDAQQLAVVQRLQRDLAVPLRIVPVPTVRDPAGLALSSRNRFLSEVELKTAREFARLLQEAARRSGRDQAAWLRERLGRVDGLKIDYIEIAGDRLCVAVWIGATRLIDNERIHADKHSKGKESITKSIAD